MANLFQVNTWRAGRRLAVGLLLAGAALRAAEPAGVNVRIAGAGTFTNRRLAQTLRLLKSDAAARPHYDAADVEDAALIIVAQLHDQGYLEPTIDIRLTLADQQHLDYAWDDELYTRLPRELAATRVHFHIRRGVRFYFRRIDFDGLTALAAGEARRFFMGTDFLLPQKSTRIFTPSRLGNGLQALVETLRRQGYEEAATTVASLQRDADSGAVKVRITVQEGHQSIVRTIRRQRLATPDQPPQTIAPSHPNQPYSRPWTQNYAQEWQRETFRQGFPDAKATIDIADRKATGNLVQIDLLATLAPGEQVRLGQVTFLGLQHTRPAVLHRRARLAPGEWLDRVEAEEARFRLSRLGIFDLVELDYQPEDGPIRDTVYTVREGKRTELSLLLGYGSYEMLRGGFEWEQRNIFGLAHRSRLRAMQSFKATSLNHAYLMPDVLPGQTDVIANSMFLRREERDFSREEYGAGAGIQRFIPWLHSLAGLRFSFARIRTRETSVSEEIGPQDTIVSAWLVDLSHERRDNPLYPQRGWNLAVNSETATEAFGGDVNFQRLEVTGSYHLDLGGGRYLHLGASHGVAMPFGSSSQDLPFNKRFFPGGENSMRGYPRTGASPLDAEGQAIGAETYLLGNLEFEQALTPQWAVVTFLDAVGIAADLADYPAAEGLYSIGLGLRWKTLVGPVRLEYGHNLNRRPHDPSGTLHFSIGFPF